jgi:hypothetical protein
MENLMILGLIALAVLGSAFFVWVGAKIAGIENATLIRSIFVAIGFAVIFWTVRTIGSVTSFIGGIIVGTFSIMLIFQASFGRALGVLVIKNYCRNHYSCHIVGDFCRICILSTVSVIL